MRVSKLQKQLARNKPYIIMNEEGEFFAGFMYGKFVWISDINEAKPLEDDGHKFEMMKTLWYRKDIIKEFID